MARVQLAVNATPPAFGYALSYALPPELLKIVEYYGGFSNITLVAWPWDAPIPPDTGKYVIEGRDLFTNDSPVLIVYLQRITDPNLMDSIFYQALATWLASKLAAAITKDTKKAADLLGMANGLLLPLGMSVDGQENTVVPMTSNYLIWGR